MVLVSTGRIRGGIYNRDMALWCAICMFKLCFSSAVMLGISGWTQAKNGIAQSQSKIMQKTCKMTETLTREYSSESTQSAIHWIPTQQCLDDFQKSLWFCAMEKRSLSIGRDTNEVISLVEISHGARSLHSICWPHVSSPPAMPDSFLTNHRPGFLPGCCSRSLWVLARKRVQWLPLLLAWQGWPSTRAACQATFSIDQAYIKETAVFIIIGIKI